MKREKQIDQREIPTTNVVFKWITLGVVKKVLSKTTRHISQNIFNDHMKSDQREKKPNCSNT